MPNAPIPFDQVTAAKKPAAVTLELINDSAHVDIVGRALDRLEKARKLDSPNAIAAAETVLDDARSAAREHTRYWRFVAISRPDYEALLAKHQATKAQREDARKKQIAAGVLPANVVQRPWNIETFPPAIVAACCIGVFLTEEDAEAAEVPDEPYMSLDQVADLWSSNRFNSAELDALFSAAQLVNQLARNADLGNG